jgi:hypothetical protein
MLTYQRQQLAGRKRATLANSDGQRRRIESIRQWKPIVVTGISFKERRLITPQNYGCLDVDPEYQRGETTSIPGIVAALQAGGTIPGTPYLAERAWGPQDGKLWVMDGQQRICALQQLNMAFYAEVYVSESLESERMFFIAANAQTKLNSDTIVKAYDGPVAVLLKCLNERPDSGLGGRIEFDGRGGKRLSASTLVGGIERMLSGGKRGSMRIDRVLSRTDGLLATNEQKLCATTFCKLVAAAFDGHAPRLLVLALAEVAADRWIGKGKRPELPSASDMKRLRAVNWKHELPSQSASCIDLAKHLVTRRWKGGAK